MRINNSYYLQKCCIQTYSYFSLDEYSIMIEYKMLNSSSKLSYFYSTYLKIYSYNNGLMIDYCYSLFFYWTKHLLQFNIIKFRSLFLRIQMFFCYFSDHNSFNFLGKILIVDKTKIYVWPFNFYKLMQFFQNFSLHQ